MIKGNSEDQQAQRPITNCYGGKETTGRMAFPDILGVYCTKPLNTHALFIYSFDVLV